MIMYISVAWDHWDEKMKIINKIDYKNSELRTFVTIGGNLRNTVNKRIIRLDADGFIDRTANWLIPDTESDNPTGSQSEFFAIIKIK